MSEAIALIRESITPIFWQPAKSWNSQTFGIGLQKIDQRQKVLPS